METISADWLRAFFVNLLNSTVYCFGAIDRLLVRLSNDRVRRRRLLTVTITIIAHRANLMTIARALCPQKRFTKNFFIDSFCGQLEIK